MHRIEALDRVASTQHGLVARHQVIGAGVSPSGLRRWVAAGRLTPVRSGVYRLAGAPPTWEQHLLAAVMAAGDGAMASHRSAARLWRLLDHDLLEVTVPARRRPRLVGVAVHRSGDVVAAHCLRRRGVRTTSPLRTLVDVGAVLGPAAVEDVLDRALEQRLLTVAGAEQALEVIGRQGRSGAGVLRAVLDHRALGTRRPDSVLEPRMARLLRDAGLPSPDFQHAVRRGRRLVARVDFAYPDVRLALEVDGWTAHSSRRSFQSDLERQNALVAMGWTVLRFTWADVVRRPDRVASQISGVLWTLRTG